MRQGEMGVDPKGNRGKQNRPEFGYFQMGLPYSLFLMEGKGSPVYMYVE